MLAKKEKTHKKAIYKESAANIGNKAELWKMADTLRGSMDTGEYKHVVLGLLFLKYSSDWSGKLLADDVRWRYDTPAVGNANYAWIHVR